MAPRASSLRLQPFQAAHLTATVGLCAKGLSRVATTLGNSLPLSPEGTPTETTAATLQPFVDGSTDDHHAWVILDGDDVVGFAGATSLVLAPDDPRFTYLPPRSATIGVSTLHLDEHPDPTLCLELILDATRDLTASMDKAWLFVNVLPGDPHEMVWESLGLRDSSVMGRRPVATSHVSRPLPADFTVRVAGPGDVEALTDLAFEERRYHTEHTHWEVSSDQRRETSRKAAADYVAADKDSTRQLVAVDRAGEVVGSIVGTIQELAPDAVQRYLLPSRYGYVGLTSVTATARSMGVGSALHNSLMRWFADRDMGHAFLHYVTDNLLSSRFWTKAGYVPHVTVWALPGD